MAGLTLDDEDIVAAIKMYVEARFGVAVNDQTKVLVSVVAEKVSAKIEGIRPREVAATPVTTPTAAPVEAERPVFQRPIVKDKGSLAAALDSLSEESTAPPPAPRNKPVTAAPAGRESPEWEKRTLVSTNLRDLGKEDPSDYGDELTDR